MYCKSENFTLYHGDNRQILPTLAENSVDAIVTDPPYELGFMGKSWDASGVAFDPATWREALRVLKPGGHLIAFSGSRTYHRMAVAIEDAGFEIRDQIMWIYGSGFPKSHNISKGLDKAAGAEREILGIARLQPDIRGNNYAQGQREYGGDTVPQYITKPATDEAKQWEGWGTALKPAHEPMVLARKPLVGTVAANVLTYGTGGLNIDGARVGKTVETWPKSRSFPYGQDRTYGSKDAPTELTQEAPAGRWPANVIHDGSDEVVALFPDRKGAVNKSTGESYWFSERKGKSAETQNGYGDSGSAARFFYCAKASKRDRNEGLDGFEEKQERFIEDGAAIRRENILAIASNYRKKSSPNS
jgi:hypothetical protein